MIHTLIVEDNSEKRSRITRALAAVQQFDMNAVEYANDVQSAKRQLHARSFDLLILDIALPLRPDTDASSNAGIDLLTEVLARPNIHRVPAHVIGITAYDEIFANAAGAFSSRLLTLVQYDPASTDWEHALQARVRHILESTSARAIASDDFHSDLAVICALYSPELTAVLNLPWNWEQVSLSNDHTIYWRGSFDREGKRHSVHAAYSARMGMPAASVLGTKMVHAFRPKYLAMTGIVAGVTGRVQLGDAIVADPCWDWGSGKSVSGDDGTRFLPAPHQIALSVEVREQLKEISRDHVLLAQIRAEWPGEKPPHVLSVHVGPLASGASVLADQSTIGRITDQHRQLLGVEMEAYGVFAAAEEVSAPRPKAFAIKSVADFADGDKSNQFQPYSAYTSSQILRYLCERYL